MLIKLRILPILAFFVVILNVSPLDLIPGGKFNADPDQNLQPWDNSLCLINARINVYVH